MIYCAIFFILLATAFIVIFKPQKIKVSKTHERKVLENLSEQLQKGDPPLKSKMDEEKQ